MGVKPHNTIIILILLCSILVSVFPTKTSQSKSSSTSTELPLLYCGKCVKICELDSPEQFYWDYAQPQLNILKQETHGFFGILMDKLDESISDLSDSSESADASEKLEQQWGYIMETIQTSLEQGFERITNSWALIVVVSNTPPLPWELSLRKYLVQEFLVELEYQYMMIGAVVKAGVKEVVGSLQRQVFHVIKQLEKHVAELTQEGENVEEMKLLEKMETSFQKMDSSNFITKIMKRIVKRAVKSQISQKLQSPQTKPANKVFFSDMMEQTAIVFEAYRKKGHIYPRFWTGITEIMKTEVKSSPKDLSSFLHHFNSNSELFADNVFAILTSSIPTPKL